MKMVIRKNSLFILTLCVCLCIFVSGICVSSIDKNRTVSSLPTIIVDAGHGGIDSGTIGCDGTYEKEINLQISRKLESYLRFFGYEVIMTRKTDDAICDKNLTTIRQMKVSDIKNRFKIIEENPDALFVSIHQNNFSNQKYYGTQTFYSPNSVSSMNLAETIQNTISKMLQKDNTRQIKQTGTEIYLLYHAKSTAVMVECGFMSNVEEMKKLKDNNYQKEVAFCILCGINDYISTASV